MGIQVCLYLMMLGFVAPPATPAVAPLAPEETYSDDNRDHWAYQPMVRSAPPQDADPAWRANPVDAFIAQAQKTAKFQPNPPADPAALLRRVTLDLTGLPPTPEETAAFLRDLGKVPDAYERVVDRLLASRAYAERMAQHWLDLAHYADSNGFELDAERPDAWRYRDWVIQAFQDDLPYDRFLTLQIAGDEVAPKDHQAWIAAGFTRSGPREVVSGNIDPQEKRQSELTEVTGTVGSVFLGLTIGCARCHNHKSDAIPTTDYYRLQSFFAGAEFTEIPMATDAEKQAYDAAKKSIGEKVAPLKKRLAELEAPYRAALLSAKTARLTDRERAIRDKPAKDRTAEEKRLAEGVNNTLRIVWEEVAEAVARNPKDHAVREELKRAIHAIEITLPRPPAHALTLRETAAKLPETFVLVRGNPHAPAQRVAPRPPGVLLSVMPENAFAPPQPVPDATSSGRRLALVRWLTRPDHPLTARVIVNRLWQQHFGRGLVATPSDFGIQGEPPSHPELLDWLALELIERGWRLKPIHRLMVTSMTYRQSSSGAHPQQIRDDPDNSLFARMPKRRLDAEAIRDNMLAVTGELNDKSGGPGVRAPLEPEVEELIFTEAEEVDLWPEDPDPREHLRRSIYLFRKRNVRYPLFDAFDAPDTQSACPKRNTSTHALQALILMNGDFALKRAEAFAARIFRDAPDNDAARVERAYLLALSRAPRPEESAQALTFLDQQTARIQSVTVTAAKARNEAWRDFASAMLNRNEFVYIP